MTGKSAMVKQFGPWALITGASSGIGAEFARQLAAAGLNIAVAARRQSLLDEVCREVSQKYGVEARTVVVDLSEEDAVERLAEAVRDLDIGLVISNAGTGDPGGFLKHEPSELRRL